MARTRLTLLVAFVAAALLAITPAAQAAPSAKGKPQSTKKQSASAKKKAAAKKEVPARLARWERRHGLPVTPATARRDHDRDGLKNLGEFRAGTNPRDPDTDDDGIEDGDERAGTIASFQDGVLELSLFDGTTLRAKVTAATEIWCPEGPVATTPPPASPAPAPTARSVRHGGDDDEDDDERDEDEDEREDEEEHPAPAPAPAPTPAEPAPSPVPADPAPAPVPAPVPGDDDEDDDEEHEDEQEDSPLCGVEALTVGRVVEEAEISVSRRGVVFSELELK